LFSVQFGIREISYTTEGLIINKEFVEIKGVCEHQDFAVVGTAISKEIVRYKLEKLKRMELMHTEVPIILRRQDC
jgi:beta-galactosidase